MRGNQITPASQAFIGHYSFPTKIIWGGENRGNKLFSISEFNGIFEWQFHGEDGAHIDHREIQKHYENIQGENYRVDKGGFNLNRNHCRPSEILRSMKLKELNLREAVNSVNLRNTVNTGHHQIGEIDEDEEEPSQLTQGLYTLPPKGGLLDGTNEIPYDYYDSQQIAQMNHDRVFPRTEDINDNTFARDTGKGGEVLRKDLHQYYSKANPEKSLDPIIQSNLMNYKYEAIDI